MNSENVKKKKKKRRKKKEKDSYKTRESQSFIFYWYEIGTCSIMDNISCLNSNARNNEFERNAACDNDRRRTLGA